MFSRLQRSLVSIEIHGETERYEVLECLAFSSQRRRMSVLVKSLDSGQVLVFSKGADDKLVPLSQDSSRAFEASIENFSRKGLRTLVACVRLIADRKVEAAILSELRDAKLAMNDRDLRVGEVYAAIERDLNLLAVCAIRDELADQVKSTLISLKKAAIKIWMVTGDKTSTAIQIGRSCGLLYSIEQMVEIDENHLDRLVCAERENQVYGVAITGHAFVQAKSTHEKKLRTCLMNASVCIIARSSPEQKSDIVEFVRAEDKVGKI